VNEADEQELRELRFKVGDALPADDPLARFILVVSMGLNDNSLSNTRFVNTKEPYEFLYFFRLASGHLHELANRLRRAHEEWPEVQEFVADLRQNFRDDFQSIVRLADPNDDVGQKLERLRNEFFHYPDLRRKTAERGKLPLMQALTDAANTEGTISLGEEALGGIRAHFADELVGEEEAQRLAREHLSVHGPDLMRQRVKVRCVDCQIGVEQVREVDPEGLGGEAEQLPITVEAPGASRLLDLEAGFVSSVEQLMVDPTGFFPIGEGQRLRPVPLGGDDRHRLVRQHAEHPRPRGQLLKRHATKPRTTSGRRPPSPAKIWKWISYACSVLGSTPPDLRCLSSSSRTPNGLSTYRRPVDVATAPRIGAA
jgi:hypothetical protein